ncbi:hypothetical protein [Nonomuraea soli]|uniref:Uncharacterized protein n=1 Tax=Nonomuraea soli TaxID=1032476 RepID=A0A7W0CM31_9ACTN|nr:hypothetical protein [Nonomuraea soli]MBA2893465.1 hypothetical protein [Nonomuraea soli]
MRADVTERVEGEQLRQLTMLQELLADRGVRALLVRHLRLALFPNRYDPPQHGGPMLVVGEAQITGGPAFHVDDGHGRSADFFDADEAAAYIRSLTVRS